MRHRASESLSQRPALGSELASEPVDTAPGGAQQGSAISAAVRRYSTRFSADGTRAACLADDGDALHAEVWDLTSNDAAPRGRRLPVPGGESLLTQLVALPGERALVVRHGADRHELVLLSPAGERPLATVTSPGFRLLTEELALGWDPDGDTTLWRVDPAGPVLEPVAGVRGVLAGGVALDLAGRQLGFTRHDADGPTAVVLDLHTGRVRPLLSGAHLLLADARSGRVLLAVQTGDGPRLAHLALRGPHAGRVVLPTAAHTVEGPMVPLAVEPGGQRVALQVERGARTHLLVHDLAADVLTEVAMPAGTIGGTAVWSGAGLRFPWSAPDCPSAIATIDPAPDGALRCLRLAGADHAPYSPAHLERFAGPAGPVEAVVHGDWRQAERVVVVLHGGPDAHWDLDFQPQLQRLARPGWAVVAPNQRGSTGYGAAHAAAIHGAWGRPDLDDVTAIGRALRAGRPAGATAPALVGESYGAFLALLAAGHAPGLWSRCAAVAPFLSGPALHAEGSAAVRALVDRLGGRGPSGGDVAAIAHRLRGPLLVMHGSADDIVPVGQSRRLRALLAGPGHPADLHYHEIAGAGHDPLADAADVLFRFLDSTCRPPEPRDRPVAVNPARPC